MNDKLYYLWLDLLEFLGNIEMRIKYFLNKKYYSSLSEEDIPKDTFYCYDGCRCQSNNGCPYMDYSTIADSKYCHYVKVEYTTVCYMTGVKYVVFQNLRKKMNQKNNRMGVKSNYANHSY